MTPKNRTFPALASEPLYSAQLHQIEPHVQLGWLCATSRSTHCEFWIADDDAIWVTTPMAGKAGTALFRKEIAASIEELELVADVAFDASEMKSR